MPFKNNATHYIDLIGFFAHTGNKFPENTLLSNNTLHTTNSPTTNLASRGTPMRKEIWAIGGGKGGIGKTLVISNMAVYLTWLKQRVVAIDMDLGGANLHTGLGVENPGGGLSDLVLGKAQDANALLQSTPIEELKLISGALDPMGIANMRHLHSTHLLKKLKEINTDFVLLDLGAGTNLSTLDYFLMADKKIVVITPEPTSVENAYRFIKSAFFRAMRTATPSPYIRQLIEQSMDKKGIQSPKQLLEIVRQQSPEEGRLLQDKMANFRIGIVLNQVRLPQEAELGRSVAMVCEHYFGMQVDNLGFLPYEHTVWRSVRNRKPFIVEYPSSQVVTHLEQVIRNIFHSGKKDES